ncbi:purine-nucleoside phosphorylase [Pseudonocardia acaciae]|uniref:purine-nucleoside phosphorylase n=1 Tax=Pseudonocardia acaciae TaxID=551276 RepID=UPI001FE0455A|nr:purine nucleoside permease [Pseudonocardia acaciae]
MLRLRGSARRGVGIRILSAFSVLLGLVSLTAGCGQGAPERFPVRVLVLTMFPVETAPWLARESLPVTIPVAHVRDPLRCAPNGLCVAVIGQGKANAAASVAEILNSPGLDTANTYFLTAGIAGTSPRAGTLGFAAWARWVVDWDLGHHVLPQSAPDIPHGYLPYDDQGTNVFRLNQDLVNRAYELTKALPLMDTPEAQENRTHYPGQATQKPFTAVCDTMTGDNYWAGAELSEEAEYITAIWTKNDGRYCTTQMEDSAVATVLARHGALGRYLSLRTASDFDQPYAGQSVRDVLSKFPGAQAAAENAYRVGSAVAHNLLEQPR